jgi:hypothetical protein
VDAAGHAYPAAQSPLHADTDKPCVLPYLPAGQSVQLPAAAVDEYRPTAHSVHAPVQPKRRRNAGAHMLFNTHVLQEQQIRER